jgi:ParB family chromosome partitioning protein
MELKEIETLKLVVDKFNVRGDDWDNDKELIDSIKSQGVLEPLLVRPIKDKNLYPKNKTYSIICGNRRWHASMEGRLKTIPCVVRNDLDDISSIGVSLQENLRSKSLDKIQEAEAIAKIWGMLNSGRTNEQKIKEINKMFGLSERSIRDYLAVSRLKESLKRHPDAKKVDMNTLASISTEDEWDNKEKKEAIKIASEINSSKERRNLLLEMKKRAEDESPKEALESIKKEMKGLQGITLNVWLNAKEREATTKACKKNEVEMETLVKRNHIDWLKKNNYL